MNSFGAYVASAATVSVPFDFTAAGTSDATFWSTPPPPVAPVLAPVDAGAEDVLLLLLPQPAATTATSASAANSAAAREILRVMRESSSVDKARARIDP